jgi:hypothetical protein
MGTAAEGTRPDPLAIAPEAITSSVAGALALYRRAGFTAIPAYGEYAASSATSLCFAKALQD